MNPSRLVAGVDCSTQATKVVVVDADTGEIVREGRAPHPEGTEVDPEAWWAAFTTASGGLLDDVAAVAVAGQQHGMVLLDGAGEVTRPAVLWNDVRSDVATQELLAELGGPAVWAQQIGVVPVPSITVTKLRWVRTADPQAAERAESVLLPHDWLTHRLCADRDPAGEATTDRGDASGTGWWSSTQERYREDLVRLAFGRDLRLARVAAPAEVVGTTSRGAAVAAGTGDNMGAALGLDLRAGDAVVSLGTSGTAFAVADAPAVDPSGLVAGFADATGRYLPLSCTLNAARVLTAAASMLDVGLAELDELALAAEGSAGLVLLPFLDGERTPPLPHSTGLVHGLTRSNATPEHFARAAVEGMLCNLAEALDAVRAQGIAVRRVLLIGGASQSRAVQVLAPALLGAQVLLPEPGEYVAVGAARQAAWAVAATPEPPDWEVAMSPSPDPLLDDDSAVLVRTRYANVLRQAVPLLT
ncbi:MAG: xylulokinase [Actinomycetes bacterium]